MIKEEKYHILIVDDSIHNLQVVGKMLNAEKYDSVFAESGREAITLLQDGLLPDVILLDIMMPEMDGFAFKKQLNVNKDWVKIPVIVISALQEMDNKAMAFGLGCVDYMVKPINKVEVNSRVDVQIKMKEQHQTLIEKNEQLALANSTREKIFSVISHDLRTSVGNVRTIFRYILDQTIDPVDSRELLVNAEISSGNASDLLDNLLYWAKSQQEKIVCKKESVDVEEMITDIVYIEKNRMEKKNISFSQDIPTAYSFNTDKILLSIIIRNLLGNAIKFTPSKGHISIFVQKKGEDSVKILVKDNGIGMSPENLTIINSHKVLSTLGTNEEKGTGVGLLLIRDCIKACGGSLNIQSNIGEGSEFIINLPVK